MTLGQSSRVRPDPGRTGVRHLGGTVHYSSGFGALALFGGSLLVPGDGLLSVLARLLLDGAGLLFGLYLVFLCGLAGLGVRLRHSAPAPGGSRRVSVRRISARHVSARPAGARS